MRSEFSKNRATSKAMLMEANMASTLRFPLPSSPIILETLFFKYELTKWLDDLDYQCATTYSNVCKLAKTGWVDNTWKLSVPSSAMKLSVRTN